MIYDKAFIAAYTQQKVKLLQKTLANYMKQKPTEFTTSKNPLPILQQQLNKLSKVYGFQRCHLMSK